MEWRQKEYNTRSLSSLETRQGSSLGTWGKKPEKKRRSGRMQQDA
jgi:hypothetical protein